MPKVLIKYLESNVEVEQHGNWIDVKSAITEHLSPMKASKGNITAPLNLIPLGFIMKLPKYYEAHLVPRSSTFKHFAAIQSNSMGVIDEEYCGPNDEWKMPLLCFEDIIINRGERIGQFRIELSQDAPWYAKLKWLFSGKVKIVKVDDLNTSDRGGFGSTGK